VKQTTRFSVAEVSCNREAAVPKTFSLAVTGTATKMRNVGKKELTNDSGNQQYGVEMTQKVNGAVGL